MSHSKYHRRWILWNPTLSQRISLITPCWESHCLLINLRQHYTQVNKRVLCYVQICSSVALTLSLSFQDRCDRDVAAADAYVPKIHSRNPQTTDVCDIQSASSDVLPHDQTASSGSICLDDSEYDETGDDPSRDSPPPSNRRPVIEKSKEGSSCASAVLSDDLSAEKEDSSSRHGEHEAEESKGSNFDDMYSNDEDSEDQIQRVIQEFMQSEALRSADRYLLCRYPVTMGSPRFSPLAPGSSLTLRRITNLESIVEEDEAEAPRWSVPIVDSFLHPDVATPLRRTSTPRAVLPPRSHRPPVRSLDFGSNDDSLREDALLDSYSLEDISAILSSSGDEDRFCTAYSPAKFETTDVSTSEAFLSVEDHWPAEVGSEDQAYVTANSYYERLASYEDYKRARQDSKPQVPIIKRLSKCVRKTVCTAIRSVFGHS